MKLVIIAILLAASSCAFAERYAGTAAAVKTPVDDGREDDITGSIETAVGEEFVITLEGNATTGYEWQRTAVADDDMTYLVTSEYLPDDTGFVGSGGRSIWTFRAVKAGTTRLSFKYLRPWEKDVPPVKEDTYIVKIGQPIDTAK